MSEGQNTTSSANQEAVALLKKHKPPTGFRKRRNAISGPSRSPIGKKEPHREKKYWPTSRSERARAPSPETPEWPTNFCLFIECDTSVPHTHTKKQIIDRIGYASWMDNLFEPALSKVDDSAEYDGLYRGRPSGMRRSSILNPAGEGTNELREALPKIGDVDKVTASLENLGIRTLDKGKSKEGSAARKD